ncbi:MAG: hypothetical protein Q9226_004253 [Calogaya cf. arnoldii]
MSLLVTATEGYHASVIGFLWNLDYLTSPLPRALHVVYLVIYFLTGSFGFNLHSYYFHTLLLQTPLPPWQYHLQSINLSMEAVLIGVFYLKQRTDIITPLLQEDWKRWYDGDQQGINRMQQKYNCCGFGDIKDMVFRPIQGPEVCTAAEKQKIVDKHTAAARQLYDVCRKLDSRTLDLCVGTQDRATATLCENFQKTYLALYTELHSKNHTTYLDMDRYLSECAEAHESRCIWQRSCSEPWSRSLQWFIAYLMLAIGVGFLVKVMLLIHLHYKKDTSTITTPDVPARPGDEMEAQGKDDDGSIATTIVDRGTLVLGGDTEPGRGYSANSQGLSSRNVIVAHGDED